MRVDEEHPAGGKDIQKIFIVYISVKDETWKSSFEKKKQKKKNMQINPLSEIMKEKL